MEKYKLSKHITVTGIDTIDHELMPDRYRQGYAVMIDECRARMFMINDTIRYFIDKFSVPKSIKEIIDEIAGELQGNSADIEETCTQFFNYLKKKKIIIPEHREEFEISDNTLLNEGDSLNGLVITEVITSNRHTDLYLAKDLKKNKDCVVKLLNLNKLAEPEDYSKELIQLEEEFRLLKRAYRITAVSKAYAFKKVNGNYAYYTQEYIPGKSLWHFVDKTENLTEADCLHLMEKMLQAFAMLHKKGIIHGDVHSSNVLVTANQCIRIIDLGLSPSAKTEKNEVPKFGGVDYYMPPERINVSSIKKHRKEPDFYSDVYQIGLLLYIILYNALPFESFVWEDLAHSIKKEEPVFAASSFLNFPVPVQLIELIKKCLHKDPLARYQNAMKILEAFHERVLKPSKKRSI